MIKIFEFSAIIQEPLDKLPEDLAEIVSSCMWNAAWSASNERFGDRDKAKLHEGRFADFAEQFKEMSKDLIPASVCDEIKGMFIRAAWAAANHRKGYEFQPDKDKFEEHSSNLKNSDAISNGLAENLKWFSWNVAYQAANDGVGNHADKDINQDELTFYFRKIETVPKLVDIIFLPDPASNPSPRSRMVLDDEYTNNGQAEQSYTFEYETHEGKTTTVSTKIGFSFEMNVAADVGFDIRLASVSQSYEFTAGMSTELGWEESLHTSVTKKYTLPVNVPPRTRVTVKATRLEATMDVPYVMVFEFGDSRRSIEGMWTGVAVSKSKVVLNEYPL